MPVDVQEKMVHSLEGLENAKILEYAYAIEYDAIDPLQIMPSLESKLIEGLFTAGQINGTNLFTLEFDQFFSVFICFDNVPFVFDIYRYLATFSKRYR